MHSPPETGIRPVRSAVCKLKLVSAFTPRVDGALIFPSGAAERAILGLSNLAPASCSE